MFNMPWFIFFHITLLESNKNWHSPNSHSGLLPTSILLLVTCDTNSQSQLSYQHKEERDFFPGDMWWGRCLGKYKIKPGLMLWTWTCNEISFLKACMQQILSKLWQFHNSLSYLPHEGGTGSLTEVLHLKILLLCFFTCRDQEESCL